MHAARSLPIVPAPRPRRLPRAGRFRLALLALAAVAVAAARSPDLGAPAGGARWSTVDLGAQHGVDREAITIRSATMYAITRETVPALAARAEAAGAELVWDLGDKGMLRVSPVVFAEPSLALPAAAPVAMGTVNLQRLYETHPKTLAHNAAIRAADATAREAAAAKLLQPGDASRQAAAALLEASELELGRRAMAFRTAMLAEVAAEVGAKARARGLSVVLDVAGNSMLLGVPTLVWVDESLAPAADGGLREGPPPAVVARTVDLARLYELHPHTIEINAQGKYNEDNARAQAGKLREALRSLEEIASEQERSGDAAAARKTRDLLPGVRAAVPFPEENARAGTMERLAKQRPASLAEIARLAGEMARRAGANLVLDTGGISHLGAPYVAYASPRLDLTDAMAKAMEPERGR